MVRLKSGEDISFKEFMIRWKKGIANITPLQKLQNEVKGTFITLLGFIVSFIAVIIMRVKIGLLAYGLILIFLGSIITTGLRFLSLKQQLKLFNTMEVKSINVEEILNNQKEVELNGNK